jgi:hypothetical protein
VSRRARGWRFQLCQHVDAQKFRVAFAGFRKLYNFSDDDFRQWIVPITRELQDFANPMEGRGLESG